MGVANWDFANMKGGRSTLGSCEGKLGCKLFGIVSCVILNINGLGLRPVSSSGCK